jgi:hypothetical protein
MSRADEYRKRAIELRLRARELEELAWRYMRLAKETPHLRITDLDKGPLLEHFDRNSLNAQIK